MNDLISRQDAIEAIRQLPNMGIHWYISAEAVFDVLLKLPSAYEWIPCSERLPNKSEDAKKFLVTKSKIESYSDADEWYTKEDRWVTIEMFFTNPDKFSQVWYDNTNIIAWMPLQEPYNIGKKEIEKLYKCPKCKEITSIKTNKCEYCNTDLSKERLENEDKKNN